MRENLDNTLLKRLYHSANGGLLNQIITRITAMSIVLNCTGIVIGEDSGMTVIVIININPFVKNKHN